ncbi:DUF2510 domain-containing protein [Subtercola vilae]|uniref:DUF2510 domain-containing protein n=1 Tax=Subtercola vilae TaxID=2056433 RepID=A0A4V4RFB4_9MICO|nr:DUF2510 domain-containing protein [Subtercola vilae]TIH37124.1 DUF2510 domain-containing protein [Subtercola vilae]
MTTPDASIAPAGWYPDPAGHPQQRWWNGSVWTEHVFPDTSGAYAAPQAGFAAGPGTAALGGAAAGAVAGAPGRAVYNAFIWIITLLPVVSILSALTNDYSGVARAVTALSHPGRVPASASSTANVGLSLLGLLVYGAAVVLAYFDWKTLRRRGFERPFHWAWAFLLTAGVYVFGRSIVMKRRAGRGMAPIWLWSALVVLGWVVAAVRIALALSPQSTGVPTLGA